MIGAMDERCLLSPEDVRMLRRLICVKGTAAVLAYIYKPEAGSMFTPRMKTGWKRS
jgi:hypothetical protein